MLMPSIMATRNLFFILSRSKLSDSRSELLATELTKESTALCSDFAQK